MTAYVQSVQHASAAGMVRGDRATSACACLTECLPVTVGSPPVQMPGWHSPCALLLQQWPLPAAASSPQRASFVAPPGCKNTPTLDKVCSLQLSWPDLLPRSDCPCTDSRKGTTSLCH